MPEIASFVAPLDQFQSGHSAYECVAFGVADIFYSGPPGGSPTGSADQIIGLAEDWYARETGSNDSSNQDGMSDAQEFDMLQGLGLKFEQLDGDLLAGTRAAIARGLPVLLCAVEASFFDVGLGRCPYAWQPAGNHCIVASGLAGDNLLVRDYANSEFFGFCREYDSGKMELVSAAVVTPRWRQSMPTGWRDDGKTLTASNGHRVIAGFRLKVLEGWEASDQPLAEESGDGHGGTFQPFMRTELRWNLTDGVTVHPAIDAQAASLRATLRQIATLATTAANSTT